MIRKELEDRYCPVVVPFDLRVDPGLIDTAEAEHARQAENDPDKCKVFHPDHQSMPESTGDLKGQKLADSLMDGSQRLARALLPVTIGGHEFGFSFTRYADGPMSKKTSYHLDSAHWDGFVRDEAKELRDDLVPVDEAWRLWVNLSKEHTRRVSYLNIAVSALRWRVQKPGYITLADMREESSIPLDVKGAVRIPPREGSIVNGLLFCASRVAHGGKEDETGHFMMGMALRSTSI